MTKKILLALATSLLCTLPAFGNGVMVIDNNNGTGGPQLLTGTADQIYASDHLGQGNAEMKTVSGAGLVKVTAGVGSLTITGTHWANVITESANFTAVAGNAYLCTATMTITLPSAVGVSGQSIMLINSGTNSILTLNTTSNQTINGKASGTITDATQWDHLILVSDGSNWEGRKDSGL